MDLEILGTPRGYLTRQGIWCVATYQDCMHRTLEFNRTPDAHLHTINSSTPDYTYGTTPVPSTSYLKKSNAQASRKYSHLEYRSTKLNKPLHQALLSWNQLLLQSREKQLQEPLLYLRDLTRLILQQTVVQKSKSDQTSN